MYQDISSHHTNSQIIIQPLFYTYTSHQLPQTLTKFNRTNFQDQFKGARQLPPPNARTKGNPVFNLRRPSEPARGEAK